MPLISTHHQMVMEDNATFSGKSGYSEALQYLINEVLKESPRLVAEVAKGVCEPRILEKSLTRILDAKGLYCGLPRSMMIKMVLDSLFGYGILQQYVEDEDITDIDGTKYNEFAIKKSGKRYRAPVDFGNERSFENYCRIIAIRNEGILNENDSHCRVTDEKLHLRINLSIRPRNLTGPTISIRKHRMHSYTLDELTGLDMLDQKSAALLKQIVSSEATVLFCGKGAAGKTTLLRAFINAMPEMERILITETDAEIFPEKPYCIEQKIKKSNEGGRPVTLRELVKDGLTMSLDTYCVGEITGDEAWEFLKAAFSGHRGLATTHAESAADSLARLLTLSKDANIGESETTIREIMARCIDIIVYLKDFKVTEILKVRGIDRSDKGLGGNGGFILEKLYEREAK